MSVDFVEQNEEITAHQIKSGSREFYVFLLGDSANSRQLPLKNLPYELELVATGKHLTNESKREEIEDLKKGSRTLAQELVKKHSLDDENRIALEQLLLGLTQANLLESQDNPYGIIIHTADETGYSLELQHGRERLNASRELFNVIVNEILDRVVLIEEGVQLRVSSNPLFHRSAARVNTIIDKVSKDPFHYAPKFIEVSPLHRITKDLESWSEYRNKVASSV